MFSASVLIVGLIAIAVVVVVFVLMFQKRGAVDLTSPTEEKPEWMRQMPPAATVAATKADGEGVQVYDHDAGERIAAPFVEQIEDIVQAALEKHPDLKKYKVDFGTAPDGSLEIWIDETKYTSVDELPDEGLKALVKDAIETWQKTS
jgi:hypothetical protein